MPESTDGVTVERDLPYAAVDGVQLTFDLYRSTATDAPVVIYLHGGGWTRGDKADHGLSRLAPLAGHGVHVAAVNYRLAPQVTFPAPLHDVKGAVRWLRAHGHEIGLPTDRLGVWGASAGGYLASLLALSAGDPSLEGQVGGNSDRSSTVQAVVDWYGPVDPATNGSRTPVEESLLPFHFEQGLVGAEEPADFLARARPLSLLPRVTADAPPFLLAHGDRDRIVPVSESVALNDALGRAGADSLLQVYAGAGHEDPRFETPAMLAMTAAWLRSTLRERVGQPLGRPATREPAMGVGQRCSPVLEDADASLASSGPPDHTPTYDPGPAIRGSPGLKVQVRNRFRLPLLGRADRI